MQTNVKFLNTESRLVELVEDQRQGLFSNNNFSKSYNYMMSSQKMITSSVIDEEEQDFIADSLLSEVTEVN
jgi:hypothetical protein